MWCLPLSWFVSYSRFLSYSQVTRVQFHCIFFFFDFRNLSNRRRSRKMQSVALCVSWEVIKQISKILDDISKWISWVLADWCLSIAFFFPEDYQTNPLLDRVRLCWIELLSHSVFLSSLFKHCTHHSADLYFLTRIFSLQPSWLFFVVRDLLIPRWQWGFWSFAKRPAEAIASSTTLANWQWWWWWWNLYYWRQSDSTDMSLYNRNYKL